VLEVGSGLGFDAMLRGARWTCADIVADNLSLIVSPRAKASPTASRRI
jgi:hypothetical protein